MLRHQKQKDNLETRLFRLIRSITQLLTPFIREDLFQAMSPWASDKY